MNRSSPGMSKSKVSLSLAKAIDGFLKFKTAEGLSQRTVDSYEWALRKWMEKIGDQPVGKITSADVLDYMTDQRAEYVSHTFAKPNCATGTAFACAMGSPAGSGTALIIPSRSWIDW